MHSASASEGAETADGTVKLDSGVELAVVVADVDVAVRKGDGDADDWDWDWDWATVNDAGGGGAWAWALMVVVRVLLISWASSEECGREVVVLDVSVKGGRGVVEEDAGFEGRSYKIQSFHRTRRGIE